MDKKTLAERLKKYAITVVRFAEDLPETPGLKTTRMQIIRSCSSSAANYRAATRGRSTKEFIAKLGVVEEELDETMFWLEFIAELSTPHRQNIIPIWKEGNELLSIIVATLKTTKNKL